MRGIATSIGLKAVGRGTKIRDYELSTDAFTGRIAIVMGAKNMTMAEVQHAHRIGECSPAKLGSAGQF